MTDWDGITPLARYQQDLSKIRPLGLLAAKLDALFHHRVSRRVRKDGTVSYQGKRFEVPFELSGKTVCLVVDPHTEVVVSVEDEHGEVDRLGHAARCAGQSPSPATQTRAGGRRQDSRGPVRI
jgi:putative transposase